MLKSLFAAIAIFIASIFGAHSVQYVAPHLQPASAAFATAQPSAAADSQFPSAAPATNPPPSVLAAATTTVIKQYITQPVIERVVQNAAGITQSQLDDRLHQLDNKYSLQFAALSAAYSSPASPPVSGGVWNASTH